MKTNWIGVLRDIIIIWVLTFLGGFFVGLTGVRGERGQLAISVLAILLMIVGFTISGCIVKVNRFKHLFVVALGVWITSIVNIFLGISDLVTWILCIITIVFSMLIGGALSLIFVRPPKSVEVYDVAYSDESSFNINEAD